MNVTLTEYCNLHYIKGRIEGIACGAEVYSKDICQALFDTVEMMNEILDKMVVDEESPKHYRIVDNGDGSFSRIEVHDEQT